MFDSWIPSPSRRTFPSFRASISAAGPWTTALAALFSLGCLNASPSVHWIVASPSFGASVKRSACKAQVIGNRLAPDIVLAVDSYATGDAPGVPFHLAPARLGQGPVLRMADNRAIASIELREQLERVAKAHGLPLQIGATGGGTDGAAIQRSGHGVHMMALSVAIRYLHSTVEMCHLDDLHNLVALLEHAVLELTVPSMK